MNQSCVQAKMRRPTWPKPAKLTRKWQPNHKRRRLRQLPMLIEWSFSKSVQVHTLSCVLCSVCWIRSRESMSMHVWLQASKPRIDCIDGCRFALVFPIVIAHFARHQLTSVGCGRAVSPTCRLSIWLEYELLTGSAPTTRQC